MSYKLGGCMFNFSFSYTPLDYSGLEIPNQWYIIIARSKEVVTPCCAESKLGRHRTQCERNLIIIL
jgi:hypothetical protein